MTEKNLWPTVKVDSASLIPVKPSGSKRPFFYVHAADGHTIDSLLRKYIDPERPFYGLRAVGRDGKGVPHTRVEEMAAHYVQEIQTVQPEGPYLLGGRCTGGNIALEMAQQLKKKGQKVLLVVMVDSPKPLLTEVEKIEYPNSVAREQAKWRGQFTNSDSDPNSVQIEFNPEVFEYNLQIPVNHIPQIYSGEVVYFSAQEKSGDSFMNELLDPHAWNLWVVNGVEIHEIPGDHLSMTKEPNIRVLAAELSSCLEQVESKRRKVKDQEKKPEFNHSLYQEITTQGYTVINFLDRDEVESLVDFDRKNSSPEDTLSSSMSFSICTANVPYRRKISQKIKMLFRAKLKLLFPEYRIAFGALAHKNPDASSSQMPLHQDNSLTDETEIPSFGVWCPLIDVDEQNGCLQVVSRSHVFNSKARPYFVFNWFPYSPEVMSLMQKDYLTNIPMKAGQALIYDKRLFHCSPPNVTTNQRVAAICTLVPQGMPCHFCFRESDTSDKIEMFEVEDEFYDRYIAGQKPEGFKSLGVFDYKPDPLTPEQLVAIMNAPERGKSEDKRVGEIFTALSISGGEQEAGSRQHRGVPQKLGNLYKSFFNLLRGNDWWFYKIPPLLAIAYGEILLQDTPPQESIITLLALLVSMFFVAAYGHVVNDIFDIEVDALASKENRMAPLQRGQRILLSLGLAVAGVIPWWSISFNSISAVSLAAIYILLTIYPAPPFRLKERYIWGAVADAATVHAIPTLLVATVFSGLGATLQAESDTLVFVATAWAFAVGMRGVLLHQIWDRENDLKSGVKTLATKFGEESLCTGINYLVFPFEAILCGGLVILISQTRPWFLFPCAVYLGLLFFSTRYDEFDPSPSQEAYVGKNILLHDFYEVWLPLSLLVLLSVREPKFLLLLALHITLFYPAIKQRLLVSARSLAGKLKKLNASSQENRGSTPKSPAQQPGKTFLESPSTDLERTLVKSISFLAENQLEDGEFTTEFDQKYENSEHREDWSFDSSLFVTSLVLYSLHFLRSEKEVQKIQDKGIKFLLEEMKVGGLWKYWSIKNKKQEIIPPDLDDICCISHLLKMNNLSVPNNMGIILGNRNKKGVFYTWVLPRSLPSIALNLRTLGKALSYSEEIWQLTDRDDVCSVVNANVLLYLGENQKTQKIIEYLIDIVLGDKEKEHLSFYDHKLSLYYMLSRAYFNGVTSLGAVKIPLVTKVLNLQETDGSFGDELLTALAICTLLNFNYVVPSLEKAIAFLLQTQQANGSWSRIPMYGGKLDQRLFGSEALTTGFCVEALARYRLLNLAVDKQETLTILTPQMRKELEEYGYVILDNFLSEAELNDLREFDSTHPLPKDVATLSNSTNINSLDITYRQKVNDRLKAIVNPKLTIGKFTSN